MHASVSCAFQRRWETEFGIIMRVDTSAWTIYSHIQAPISIKPFHPTITVSGTEVVLRPICSC